MKAITEETGGTDSFFVMAFLFYKKEEEKK